MIYKYAHIPRTVKFQDLKNNILSSSMYRSVDFGGKKTIKIKNLLERQLNKSSLGKEIGSAAYIKKSSHYFIRTQCLNENSYTLIPEKGQPMLPQEFDGCGISKGDIIISKDGNIGEICIAAQDYPNYMLSGALYKLSFKGKFKNYAFAWIKNKIFREQLDTLVPKGATLRHAKTKFLDCDIIIPYNYNNEVDYALIDYINVLVNAIIEKESQIRQIHNKILSIIHNEIISHQQTVYQYSYPNLKDLAKNSRIDAGYYCEKYKQIEHTILNYNGGYEYLDNIGLLLIPGPSLEMKLLQVRIDSDKWREGYYRLITPTVISNFGVTTKDMYIGTPRNIPFIKKYDMLFGESGTGRSMVFLDDDKNVINNAHAHILRPQNCTIHKTITTRCVLQYYKEIGFTDYLTVGGAGGHLSPSYFNRVPIPNFSEETEKVISKLYYSQSTIPYISSFNDFEDVDHKFNQLAGIYELDKTAKLLKKRINSFFENLFNGSEINIEFY
ncbi:MAG: hypothetical protein IJL45_03400 [Prevotella sp.]|nr:hypothetical protein [Prevotella sp.]